MSKLLSSPDSNTSTDPNSRGTGNNKAISFQRRATKLQHYRRRMLFADEEHLPRLRGLFKSARSISRLRSKAIRRNLHKPPPGKKSNPFTPPSEIQIYEDELRKPYKKDLSQEVLYHYLKEYETFSFVPATLPPPPMEEFPEWVQEALDSEGFTSDDLVSWIRAIRARTVSDALKIMESGKREWPKHLIYFLLYTPKPKTQNDVVRIFALIQDKWKSFDPKQRPGLLLTMAEIAANRLPKALPRIANLFANSDLDKEGLDVGSKQSFSNKLIRITAEAIRIKSHENYTSLPELRNFVNESLILLLDKLAKSNVWIEPRTLDEVFYATLAEDTDAYLTIRRLMRPHQYVELLKKLKGQQEGLALAHEMAKVENQLSVLEREFVRGHLLRRLPVEGMFKRLTTINNWRVSAQETFSAWIDFQKRRELDGPAPKEAWSEILTICHDEWTFPSAFWEEAFDLMEVDRVLPDTNLLCLVLKGVKEPEVLDRILETATTRHFQRMNDQVWQVYLQRLSITNPPRALEIFLNAHNTDSAAGTMDTLNVYYWNILLHGLAVESRRTNDMVWVTRAFDLLAEMERLSIFPSQHTLNAVCKLGQWTGDKCLIDGVPAWKAALDKWHEWIIRPEDFGFKFYLPGIARLIPSQQSFRSYIRLAGNHGAYAEVFDASWAMVRFGVQPDWGTLLDLDVFMQLSRDPERTLAVREMFREWLGEYPSVGQVMTYYRSYLRTEADRLASSLDAIEAPKPDTVQENFPDFKTRVRSLATSTQMDGTGQIEAPEVIEGEKRLGEESNETVVGSWLRRQRAVPWFER